MKKAAICILVSLAGLLPAISFGQTDAYIIEAVEEQERIRVQEQTIPARQPDFTARGPVTMRDESRIGAARAATRGGRGGNTMLRYGQHRELTPPAHSTLRVGPWYTDVGVSLSAGYRYSRFRRRDPALFDGAGRGEIRESGSELPLTATLHLNNYVILSRRLDFSLNLRMSYYHYPLGTQDDQLFVDLTDEGIYATFSSQFHPTRDSRVLIYDDIVYLTDFVDRRGISDRLDGREYKLFQNTLGVDWDWLVGPFDAFSASVSRTDVLPQSRAFLDQRRVQYAEMGSYRRQFNPFAAGGILLLGQQSLAQTENRPDSFIHGYSFFTGVNLTQTLDFNASVGQQFSIVRGGRLESSRSRQATTATASLDQDLDRDRWQRLYARRVMEEDFEGGVNLTDTFGYRYEWSGIRLPGRFSTDYAIVDPQDDTRNGYSNWSTRLHVRSQITRVVPLHLSADYSMRFNNDDQSSVRSTQDETIDDIQSGADYQTLSLVARTGLRISQKINFWAYAQHLQRTSDDPRLAYTRETYGLQLTWSHDF
jgi:hypothetical protein